jgi:hypothetical protein
MSSGNERPRPPLAQTASRGCAPRPRWHCAAPSSGAPLCRAAPRRAGRLTKCLKATSRGFFRELGSLATPWGAEAGGRVAAASAWPARWRCRAARLPSQRRPARGLCRRPRHCAARSAMRACAGSGTRRPPCSAAGARRRPSPDRPRRGLRAGTAPPRLRAAHRDRPYHAIRVREAAEAGAERGHRAGRAATVGAPGSGF